MTTPTAPPSLLICVDEFAALTAEVPEFVDGMVNIAQRGRSLGMHLILATQRPAGVVTPQHPGQHRPADRAARRLARRLHRRHRRARRRPHLPPYPRPGLDPPHRPRHRDLVQVAWVGAREPGSPAPWPRSRCSVHRAADLQDDGAGRCRCIHAPTSNGW